MGMIQNTEKVQVLIATLDEYNRCLRRRNACYKECEYSPGYDCEIYDEDLKSAAGEFGSALNALIDERVRQVLALSPTTEKNEE